MIKKPSERKKVSLAAAEKLANELANKTYGASKDMPEEIERTTISLPKSLLQACEDLAIVNKREGKEHRSFSAIVRAGLELYLKKRSR